MDGQTPDINGQGNTTPQNDSNAQPYSQQASSAQPASSQDRSQGAYNAAYGVGPNASVSQSPYASSGYSGQVAQGQTMYQQTQAQSSQAAIPQAQATQPQVAQHAAQSQSNAAIPSIAQASPAPYPVEAPKKKGSSAGKTFIVAFAGALIACVLAIGAGTAFGLFGNNQDSTIVSLGAATPTTIEAAEAEQTLAEAVADKCLPSVVSITVYSTATNSNNPFYEYLYGYGYGGSGQSGSEVESGLGSGVVLTEDGYIITNNHVVEGGTRFDVSIDGETYEADLVGVDASSDVAVIKARNASGLTAIEIADSDNIKIGEWVMSIGSPFGLEQSVATGIVSATSRSQIMDSSSSDYYGSSSGSPVIYPNLIQTDAAINPGNSGGALVNANGELIGINTLITSYSGNYSGVGFAIPSNYAMGITQDIIAGKEPTHAQLGVSLNTVNDQIASRYGFDVNFGAYVASVSPGSGADAAGIKVGDIITNFDGKKVSSASDLMMDVRTKSPGDKVTITVNRDGETQDIEVTLGSSQQSSTQQAPTQQNRNGLNNSRDY